MMPFSRVWGSFLLAVCLGAFAACSFQDESNTEPAIIAAAPRVHISIENSSSQTLNLPMVLAGGSGWLRVDEHPNWFVWSVPAEFDSSSICEDVTHEQLGTMPTEAATLRPAEVLDFDWKTNVFGAEEVRRESLGRSHCIHVAPAPHGTYAAKLCADLHGIACSVPPGGSEFPTQCLPVTLEVGPGDTSLRAEFTAEQFPTNRCAADG